MENINTKWECHLCADEYDFSLLPGGYLGNYHPICILCADAVLAEKSSKHYNRLTFHYKKGDLIQKSQAANG